MPQGRRGGCFESTWWGSGLIWVAVCSAHTCARDVVEAAGKRGDVLPRRTPRSVELSSRLGFSSFFFSYCVGATPVLAK